MRPTLYPPILHTHLHTLHSLDPVRYYIKLFSQKEINAFATCVAVLVYCFCNASPCHSHASRYFELYLPSGSIEIAHTQRYSHRTGKSELCILATRPLAPGAVLSELKGSMADLTDQEDQELKRTDRRHSYGGIRRDFSVIHSKQLKKNHLFLGPARFVNVSPRALLPRTIYLPLRICACIHTQTYPSASCSSPWKLYSTTVITTVNFSAKAGTLRSVSSSLLRSVRRSQLIMEMDIVRFISFCTHSPSYILF